MSCRIRADPALAKRLQIAVATLLTLLAFADDALAWGDQGHKVICEIAIRRVSADTRAEIARLMATDQDFTSFADACTWADHPALQLQKPAAEGVLEFAPAKETS